MIRRMDKNTRDQATDAALLVLLAQGILKLKEDPSLHLPVQMSNLFAKIESEGRKKVLLEKANQAGAFKQVQVLDLNDEVGAVLYCLKKTRTYLFAFCSTRQDRGEWADNAQGMYTTQSPFQKMAADYFDRKCESLPKWARVIVAGHSKGGNKAQFITMFANHRQRIERSFSFNGQGFSHEAMKEVSLLKDAAKQRELLTLIAGENDTVHPMGLRLALEDNTYYIRTNRRVFEAESNFIVEDHSLVTMFQGDGGDLRPFLQEETEQGPVSRFSQSLSEAMMDMEPEHLRKCTDGVMALMEGDQSAFDYVDIMADLIYYAGPEVFNKLKNSPEGEALRNYLKGQGIQNAKEEVSERLERFWNVYEALSDEVRSFAADSLEDVKRLMRTSFDRLTDRNRNNENESIKGIDKENPKKTNCQIKKRAADKRF